MPYTKEDVGDVPGKPPLTDAQKQAIAEEWNATEAAAQAAPAPVTTDDKIEALIETQADPQAVRDAAQAKANARKGGRGR